MRPRVMPAHYALRGLRRAPGFTAGARACGHATQEPNNAAMPGHQPYDSRGQGGCMTRTTSRRRFLETAGVAGGCVMLCPLLRGEEAVAGAATSASALPNFSRL